MLRRFAPQHDGERKPITRSKSIPTEPPRARALIVGTGLRGAPNLLRLEDSIQELYALADTAGLDVVGELTQRLDEIEPATLIGAGKVEELKTWRDELDADIVLFDDELSPRHQRNLEKILGDDVRVLDRTALILDIFAQHAQTREGALQVELAQYEYRLPRLTRQWTHLARQAGGAAGRGGTSGVGLRGPGETQLEVDRRGIRERIAFLKRQIEDVRTHRQQYRSRRRRAHIPVVSIVGYTNAGKSTLLNALSGSSILAEDKLFATLDPTTRRVRLPGSKVALFTDTVGFIQKLPTQLVAAFRATLEEIEEADLLLHVVDIAHPNAREQAIAVKQTLEEIGIRDIPLVTALNKIDRLPEPEAVRHMLGEFTHSVAISAEQRIGLEDLLAVVQRELFESAIRLRVRIPHRRGDLIALFHASGAVEVEEHDEKAVLLAGRLPARLLSPFRPFMEKQ